MRTADLASARRCASCHDTLLAGRFDAAFRDPEGRELLALDLDAWICRGCQQLFVDHATAQARGLVDVVCTMAIGAESKVVASAHSLES